VLTDRVVYKANRAGGLQVSIRCRPKEKADAVERDLCDGPEASVY
jgi:hypothetical protein